MAGQALPAPKATDPPADRRVAQPVVLALQAGAGLLADGGRRGDFHDPRFRRPFEFYVSLFAERLAPPSGTAVASLPAVRRRVTSPRGSPGGTSASSPPHPKGATGRLDNGAAGAVAERDFPGVSLAGGSSLVIFRASSIRRRRSGSSSTWPVSDQQWSSTASSRPAAARPWTTGLRRPSPAGVPRAAPARGADAAVARVGAHRLGDASGRARHPGQRTRIGAWISSRRRSDQNARKRRVLLDGDRGAGH